MIIMKNINENLIYEKSLDGAIHAVMHGFGFSHISDALVKLNRFNYLMSK